MEVTIFCSLIREATFYHLCHILPVRRKSLVQSTLKGRGRDKGMDYRRWESLEATLEVSKVSVSSSEDGVWHIEVL